jgi:hypothetical protein
MKHAVIAASIATLVAAGAGGWYYVDQRIRGEIDARLAAAVESGQYEALNYDELSYSFDGSIDISGLHVQQLGRQYRLEEVKISKLDYSQEFPREVQVSIRGLHFPEGVPDLSDTGNAQLGALLTRIAEDDRIPLEVDYSHTYQPDKAHQLDSTVAVRVPELLNLDFNSTMRELPMDALAALGADSSADPLAMQQQLLPLVSGAELPLIEVSLQDLGLVQAMMEAGASEFNATPEDYRNLLVSQARNAYLFLPQNAQQLGMDAGNELANFLEGGRTLSLKLEPQFNGSIAQLQTQLMGAMLIGNFNGMAELLNYTLITR